MSHGNLTPVSLLAQADLLLLVADWLRSPSEVRQCRADVQPAELNALVQAAGLAASPEIVLSLEAVGQNWRHADFGDVSDEYHRLFEGAMVCPLNETAYIRRDKGAILGDLAGYYRAFGWTPTGHGGEKADHLLTELEFVAMLLSMAARAEIEQRQPAVDVTREAMASFASDHLNDWLAIVCEHIGASTALPLYVDASKAVSRVWQALVALHGWPEMSLPTAATRLEEADWPPECGGMCPQALAAGQGPPTGE